MRMTCQRMGRPPISTSGFGIVWVCSRSRVPRPPQRMTTLGALTGRDYGPRRPGPLGSVPGEARAQLAGGLRRLVDDAARGALEPAPLAERDAEHAPARVARRDGDPSGDPGDRGSGAGGRGRDLALAALVRAAVRGSFRLAGGGLLGCAHRAPLLFGRVRLGHELPGPDPPSRRHAGPPARRARGRRRRTGFGRAPADARPPARARGTGARTGEPPRPRTRRTPRPSPAP